jgi:HNH endonuclease
MEITNQQVYRTFFYYDPETGLLFRRRNLNKPVGWLNVHGYIETKFMSESIVVHRIIWIYMNGDIPKDLVMDHVNGIRTDNRISNLRLATRSENSLNSTKNKNNTSGVKGVTFHKQKQMWGAKIRMNGLVVYEAYFLNKVSAESAVQKAREFYCKEFTNHGVNNESTFD